LPHLMMSWPRRREFENLGLRGPITSLMPPTSCFILLGQGGPSRLMWMQNHLLHAVDDILDKPLSTELRNEAVSVKKKLRNGNGGWATRKLILGWTLDSEQRTIELPPHRSEACVSLLRDLASSRRVSTKRWASAMGKLQFISYAVPGSAALFSALQSAMNLGAASNRIWVTKEVRHSLLAFLSLVNDLSKQPAHLPGRNHPRGPALSRRHRRGQIGRGWRFLQSHQLIPLAPRVPSGGPKPISVN